ncbi:TetR/AcrR family transcriptional regulator C-terminal domain-containing protein [Nocardia australiensis]|uniref:TetR/AcrR family transcriptional regulator C-terminal domain-containing protein n=1 Tax=Nocardia australiensis TaxID=2887191 RepID=UPI001D14376C|nr:TetR/AcrR family transcriptional regulator C-terminal domain-containing protein [Nocardia australiensis]
MTKQFTSVWTREPRQPKTTGLRLEQIVAAAVELLDAEGLDALSMRKLGAKLGAGATSIYWYVANKDELLELTLDEIWGLVETPDPAEASWREVVTTYGYNLRATLLAHPWAAILSGQLPSMGPNAFRLSDRLRRTLTQAGFTGVDVYLAAGTVTSYVLGQVVPEITLAKVYNDDDYDIDYLMQMMEPYRDEYPEMLDEYRKAIPADLSSGRAVAFDFGLLCVMDGLESRLRAGPAQHPSPPSTQPSRQVRREASGA